jgi:hypothetical protein
VKYICADDYLDRRFDRRHFNCWHFVRDVWRDMTGVDLGDLSPSSVAVEALAQAAGAEAQGPRFRRVEPDSSKGPCLVLAERRGWMPHIGVLLRARVLHLRATGTGYDAMRDFAQGFERVACYLPVQTDPADERVCA